MKRLSLAVALLLLGGCVSLQPPSAGIIDDMRPPQARTNVENQPTLNCSEDAILHDPSSAGPCLLRALFGGSDEPIRRDPHKAPPPPKPRQR